MSGSVNEYTQFAHQSNYIGVGVTRGLHSSTAAIYSGSASYEKLGTFVDAVGATPSVTIDYDGGSKQYTLDHIPDIFIGIGIGIGTVGIRSETQVIINTESTENPNVQVGDVVNFDALGGLLDQRSRVVGVGTFYFIIEDNINNINAANGDCSVTKLETFLPTGIGATGNYRGAICLNDGDNNAGDFDDFIVRCHSANISGSGSGSVVTSYNYENNGAFYGYPVSGDSEQHGGGGVLKGYIFNDDGLRGNDADAAGGIAETSTWKRVKNTFYRYSIPTISMEYINGGDPIIDGYGTVPGASESPNPAGQHGRYQFLDSGAGLPEIKINLVDANGHDNEDFFFNTIGRDAQGNYPDPTLWNFKITSLETKSEVGIYSSERSYVWCRIRTSSTNGDVFTPQVYTSPSTAGTPVNQRNTWIKYSFQVIASNTNTTLHNGQTLGSAGFNPGVPENNIGFGGTAGGTKSSIIEWFKSDNTADGNNITFHGSCDAGNNTAFLIATQLVQDNTWIHRKKEFAKDDLSGRIVATNKRFDNLDRDILPNLDYRVWNFSTGNTATTRPYFKIINHPLFDTADE